MSELAIVDITKELSKQIKYTKVKEQIVNRIKELNLHTQSYKNNQEILLLICNLIEYLIKKSDNIPKKDLAIDIITELYSLNAIERGIFESNIEFLCSSKMIKKVSKFKLFCAGVCEWLFSKKK